MPQTKAAWTFSLQNASFYAILDTSYVQPEHCVSVCQQLLNGGAPIVQLRAKRQTTAEREGLIQQLLPLFEHSDSPLIINDDIELAKRHPQLGLHIGQEDCPIEQAREELGEERIIGLSTHSIQQAKGAIQHQNLLNYFAVGPVFSTQTKPDYTPVGLELVSKVAKLNPPLPWFCIGGINQKNAHQVREAGARAVVAVSDVLCANDVAEAVRRFAV